MTNVFHYLKFQCQSLKLQQTFWFFSSIETNFAAMLTKAGGFYVAVSVKCRCRRTTEQVAAWIFSPRDRCCSDSPYGLVLILSPTKNPKAQGGASFLPEHTPDKNPNARGSLASLVNLPTCGGLPSLVAGQKWQQRPKIIKNPSIASFIAWGRGVKIGDYRGNVLKNNGFWALFTRQLLIN